MVGHWATDLNVSIGESSNPVVDNFRNSVSGMILKFFEKILTMHSAWSMIFSILPSGQIHTQRKNRVRVESTSTSVGEGLQSFGARKLTY